MLTYITNIVIYIFKKFNKHVKEIREDRGEGERGVIKLPLYFQLRDCT